GKQRLVPPSAPCDFEEPTQNQKDRWGGRWESNPQRPEPQSGALPVELLPPHLLIITSALQVRLEREVFGLQIQRMGNVDFRIKEQISDSRLHISLRKRGQAKIFILHSAICILNSSFNIFLNPCPRPHTGIPSRAGGRS